MKHYLWLIIVLIIIVANSVIIRIIHLQKMKNEVNNHNGETECMSFNDRITKGIPNNENSMRGVYVKELLTNIMSYGNIPLEVDIIVKYNNNIIDNIKELKQNEIGNNTMYNVEYIYNESGIIYQVNIDKQLTAQ